MVLLPVPQLFKNIYFPLISISYPLVIILLYTFIVLSFSKCDDKVTKDTGIALGVFAGLLLVHHILKFLGFQI